MTAPRGDGNAPGASADRDPVRAMLAAERDGLLTYLGYSAGDRYEVVLAGETRELPLAEVAPTVERLRAVAQLAAEGVDAQLVSADGTYVVEVAGHRRELPAGEVVDWCSGYAAASRARGQEHTGDDRLGEIRSVLEAPSLSDQCRMVILGLMHGGDVTVSTPELARKVDRSKKTVIEALTFGKNSLDMELADRMIEAFELRWLVSAVGPEVFEAAELGRPVEHLPQMPGIERLERIMAAADLGWVRYVDEPSPNKARWARRFELAVGGRSYTVDADGLQAWLDGVAAFHGRALGRTEQG